MLGRLHPLNLLFKRIEFCVDNCFEVLKSCPKIENKVATDNKDPKEVTVITATELLARCES